MEFALGRSGHEGRVKKEKRSESASSGGGDDEGHRKEEIDVEVPPMEDITRPSASSTKKEEAEKLDSAKAEMGEVREENQRLKLCLDRVLKDYRTLQMQFQGIVQKETKESSADHKESYQHNRQAIIPEESELVSLSLGRVPSNIPRNNEKSKVFKSLQLKNEECKEDLALGLDCKFETSKSSGSLNEANDLPNINPSSTNSSEVAKEGETKALKTARDNNGEDEVSQQNHAKKARVSVKVRCDTPTMNDGCQWRKYGQKIAKGNPCPRAYYRCTVAPSCPVKKQVQRCAEDMSILIITYEGIHNHPLPLSATAMASTTSAAASMLLSGSSTSRPSTSSTSADLHGLNFYLSDGSNKSKQFYVSNPSLSSLSPSHPTITLDLTTTTNPTLSRFTSSNYNPPRLSSYSYPPSTSLSFSSPNNDILNRNVFSSMNVGRPTMENIFRLPYMQKNNVISNPTPPPQPALPDTVAAATKAITADPKFQSALAVALSSIIGTGSGIGIGTTQGNHVGENLAQKMKWGELFPASSSL